MSAATILIIDDDELTRKSLGEALRTQRYEVQEAGDVAEGLERLRSTPSDVVLLDLCLPGTLGQDGLALILREHPKAAVVIVTGTATVDDAVACMKSGAADLVTKPVRLSRLFDAVMHALRDSARAPGQPDRRLASRLAAAREAWGLTDRETSVLEAIIQGNTNKEIAGRHGCSIRTVELHVSAILDKSATGNRTALAARFWLAEP